MRAIQGLKNKVYNYYDTKIKGEAEIGSVGWDSEETEGKQYAGPVHGWVTPEKYDELLNSGALGAGQQTVETVTKTAGGLVKGVWEGIPGTDVIESGVQSTLSHPVTQTTGNVLGKVWGATGLQKQVNQLISIADAPVAATQWLSQRGFSPDMTREEFDQYISGDFSATRRGIGRAPLTIAELLVTLGGKQAIKQGGKLISKVVPEKPLLQLAGANGMTGGAMSVTGGLNKVPDFPPLFKVSTIGKHSGLGTGSKGRAKKKDVTGPGSGATHITQGGYWDPKSKTSLTNVHHVGGLEDQGRAAVAHRSYVEGQRSPVVMYAERHYGIRGGNWKENLVDILENKTNVSRQERVRQIHKQLDGSVHPKTIDDLLGTSDLKLREYTRAQLDARREFKRQYPNVDYPEELKFGNIKTPDLFPEVKIRDSKGKVIDTWRAKDIDEYERRYEIITEKYYGGKRSVNRKAIKTDPKLDIYSNDHSHTHNLIREARKTEGNPLYVLETAIENGTYQNMPVGQAAKLYADAHKYQGSIASAVLQRRYTHIQELWLERYPNGNRRGAFKFDDLDKAAKKRFFTEYAHKIGSRGGLHEKGVKASEVLLDAKEGWTPGMTDVFGWNPNADLKPTTPKTRLGAVKKLDKN